jgi:hypothetical protein
VKAQGSEEAGSIFVLIEIKIHTTSGYVIDLEIQVENVPNMREQIALYTSKIEKEYLLPYKNSACYSA